jgi:hypothetical protein
LEVAPVGWSGTATDPLLIWCNVANLHFTASISDVTFRATIGVEIGKGKANTNLMVSRCSSGAGVLANAYKGGGKSDWFLPSRDELNELCKYAKYQATGKGDDVCQKGTSSVGGFDYQPLWSSSEATAGGAWGQNFYYGTYIENLSKYNLTSVRPIRAF